MHVLMIAHGALDTVLHAFNSLKAPTERNDGRPAEDLSIICDLFELVIIQDLEGARLTDSPRTELF